MGDSYRIIRDFLWKLFKVKALITWYDILVYQNDVVLNSSIASSKNRESVGEFMFSMISIYFVISAVGTAFQSSTWIDSYSAMSDNDVSKFEELFNVKISKSDIYKEIWIPGESSVSLELKKKIGSIDSTSIIDFMRKSGKYDLALVFYDGDAKAKLNNRVKYFLSMFIFPIGLILHAYIVHNLLSQKDNSVELPPIIYIQCFFLPVFGVLEVISWWYAQSALADSLFRISISLFVALKCGGACNIIYNSGFVKGYAACMFAAAILIIPICLILAFSMSIIM